MSLFGLEDFVCGLFGVNFIILLLVKCEEDMIFYLISFGVSLKCGCWSILILSELNLILNWVGFFGFGL